jgi:hypothetical protein
VDVLNVKTARLRKFEGMDEREAQLEERERLVTSLSLACLSCFSFLTLFKCREISLSFIQVERRERQQRGLQEMMALTLETRDARRKELEREVGLLKGELTATQRRHEGSKDLQFLRSAGQASQLRRAREGNAVLGSQLGELSSSLECKMCCEFPMII